MRSKVNKKWTNILKTEKVKMCVGNSVGRRLSSRTMCFDDQSV